MLAGRMGRRRSCGCGWSGFASTSIVSERRPTISPSLSWSPERFPRSCSHCLPTDVASLPAPRRRRSGEARMASRLLVGAVSQSHPAGDCVYADLRRLRLKEIRRRTRRHLTGFSRRHNCDPLLAGTLVRSFDNWLRARSRSEALRGPDLSQAWRGPFALCRRPTSSAAAG